MSEFVSGRSALLVIAAAFAMLACGAGGGSASSAPASAVTVGDADNGGTVTVAPGERLLVALGSTYWTFRGSSDPGVLRQLGQPVVSPGSCPPGVGCGLVSATFEAVRPGRAT